MINQISVGFGIDIKDNLANILSLEKPGEIKL